ncbi:conserved hypothetical protein [Ricinus communis]|uniref:Uncharacterized protein n=1 Tax=Ricinus communis TaxID=3988 RepID=B9RSU3_RICCO|nr:conserved hypothetical protein [Ricinus communis]
MYSHGKEEGEAWAVENIDSVVGRARMMLFELVGFTFHHYNTSALCAISH